MVTTAFEDSGGSAWTTVPEATAFLDQVQSETTPGRSMTRRVLGKATLGVEDVEIVSLSSNTTPTDAPAVLLTAGQHGNEYASREMALQTIRDLATGDDPTAITVLDNFRVHVIHTASPEGIKAGTRTVPGGTDPNRQHLTFAAPEPKMIQQAITDTDPFLVVDAHEHFSPSAIHARFLIDGNRHFGDGGLWEKSQDLMVAIQQRFDSLSLDHGIYPSGQYRGSYSAVATMRNRIVSLLETPAYEGFAIDPAIRVGWHVEARDAIFGWLVASGDAAAAEVEAANLRARNAATLDLGRGMVTPVPVAYELPAPVPEQVEVFGLDHTVEDGVVTVPLAQPSRLLVANLFDPDAPEHIFAAERVLPDGSSFFGRIRIQVDGQRVTPIGVKVRIDGQILDILDIRIPGSS